MRVKQGRRKPFQRPRQETFSTPPHSLWRHHTQSTMARSVSMQTNTFSYFFVHLKFTSAFHQWRSKTAHFEEPKCLVLGEQQYFVCDTASQSTKCLDILKILGVQAPWAPLATPMLSTPKTLLRTIFYIKLIYSMNAEFLWIQNSSKYYIHK